VSPVADLTPRAAALLRKRAVLHMMILTSLRDPGANWARMVGLTITYGRRLPDPIHASEVQALRGMTVGELFDLARCGVPSAELRAAVAAGETQRERDTTS
jgi:hypothetical protein